MCLCRWPMWCLRTLRLLCCQQMLAVVMATRSCHTKGRLCHGRNLKKVSILKPQKMYHQIMHHIEIVKFLAILELSDCKNQHMFSVFAARPWWLRSTVYHEFLSQIRTCFQLSFSNKNCTWTTPVTYCRHFRASSLLFECNFLHAISSKVCVYIWLNLLQKRFRITLNFPSIFLLW